MICILVLQVLVIGRCEHIEASPSSSINPVLSSTAATNSTSTRQCLIAGSRLYVNEYLVNKAQSRTMKLTTNGNMCMYITTPLNYQNESAWTESWCLGISNSSQSYAEVNVKSGSFRLVSTTGKRYCISGEKAGRGAYVVLQNNYNLVLYAYWENPYW